MHEANHERSLKDSRSAPCLRRYWHGEAFPYRCRAARAYSSLYAVCVSLDRGLLRIKKFSEVTSMIHWKISMLPFAIAAGATLGFVWLARTRPKLARAPLPLFDADEAAHDDAIRDLEHDGENVELEFADVEELGPTELRSLDEEKPTGDDQYDAVDPEDMGTEWLRRATEAPQISQPEAGPPVAASGDMAQEIPVGSIDSEGNAELHPAEKRSKEAIDLPPNDDELAKRASVDTDPAASGTVAGSYPGHTEKPNE
jgi:hypothetical protein